MNNFTQAETEAAQLLFIDAHRHANAIAEKADVPVVRRAILLHALQIDGLRVCQDCKCVCKNEN